MDLFRRPFLVFLTFRILNALVLKTFFQPDEYFQSLEPAWAYVFGPGSGAWVTWEWTHQLRSSLHPMIFAAVYSLISGLSNAARISSEGRANLLLYGPKVLQAVIAATGDLYTCRLASSIHQGNKNSKRLARVTAALTLFSAWQFFFSTRTFSNALETSLTAAALSYWPWSVTVSENSSRNPVPKRPYSDLSARLRVCLLLAAFACILRPTNLLVWLPLAGFILRRKDLGVIQALIREGFLTASFVLLTAGVIDRVFYGAWTFPPLRFIKFNIGQSIAVFYGANDWHYYLSQGLPLLLTTYLFFGCRGLVGALRAGTQSTEAQVKFQLCTAVVFMIVILSQISHKEVRFISPLLPMLHVLSAESAMATIHWIQRQKRVLRTLIVCLFYVAQLGLISYVSVRHQSGVVDVMQFLRHEYETKFVGSEMGAGFLMPCHSTPWRSHLMYPQIKSWALTCEPPINMSPDDRETYLDEADRFYADPQRFTKDELAERLSTWPEYLVMFEQLRNYAKEELSGQLGAHINYHLIREIHNSDWHDDWRRQGNVLVYSKI